MSLSARYGFIAHHYTDVLKTRSYKEDIAAVMGRCRTLMTPQLALGSTAASDRASVSAVASSPRPAARSARICCCRLSFHSCSCSRTSSSSSCAGSQQRHERCEDGAVCPAHVVHVKLPNVGQTCQSSLIPLVDPQRVFINACAGFVLAACDHMLRKRRVVTRRRIDGLLLIHTVAGNRTAPADRVPPCQRI